jgi:integrase
MGVYARPDSPFWWFWLDGTTQRVNTKIKRVAATPEQTKDNRRLAEAAYHASMGDLARDRFALPTPGPARTFDAQAAWYEAHHTVHHRGAVQERRKLARLRASLGSCALETLTPTIWQEYVTERTKEGAAVNTIGRELAIAKAILNTAVGSYLAWSPLAGVKRKTSKVKPKRTVTAKEDAKLRRALKRIDPELHDLYVVGLGTLLRRENLIYLRRGSHRGDRLVVDTKTGPHSIPLTGPTPLQRQAAAVLTRRMPKTADGFFFPKWRARFDEYEDVGHPSVLFLKKVRRAAATVPLPWGLKADGIVWHTATRASGATRLLRDYAIDIRTVQVMGGWSSLDQMAAYLGVDKEALFGRERGVSRTRPSASGRVRA